MKRSKKIKQALIPVFVAAWIAVPGSFARVYHWHVSTASWYNDAGNTASGRHYRYGVANKYLKFGTRVRFCKVRCATGVVDDRGPFIVGRDFDLNLGLKNALGCGSLCLVRWRLP